MLTHKEQSLLDALVPHAEEKGVELVTVEVIGSKKAPTIRVYIDTAQGVGFDELAEAQVWINDVMERIDPFTGAYTLEVSSPGIDRPLRTPEHFARFAGSTAVVKTSQGIAGRSSFSATIVSADEKNLVLNDDGTLLEIPFELIKKAHLKGIIDFNAKKEL